MTSFIISAFYLLVVHMNAHYAKMRQFINYERHKYKIKR
ncbi:hypothetical protein YPPY66_1275 [Yersinia pestis PY-66]|uniref:Uncharacterized protein n=2 Tax=Yersinia pestis TaxID=632 RepID=A0AAV3BCB7_YERPE|nr:hypothetical protein YpAngola_A0150 [Yersinia pestis Angola]EDR33377.1 hypothetical protein YPIP275_4434 [Yersinia pestis biovar Orientalis str. IP275]EDR40371.1 hypothetical protein YpF1991016_1134 [Yersinia pestis biovar Orientalis str. F1991016]EDR43154.1 hypothetical protein YpE1979001_3501 [Yersinia pestis biovar Antiqua str. E1979001]EDR50637.1 hypothetical protein YpB42003004_3007 [Yersinia pestis biovar Antiqua str. B42003004]EDR56096.1 hypothetical protein YpMG051020_3827 [Yersinia